jgi:hypothetical protein
MPVPVGRPVVGAANRRAAREAEEALAVVESRPREAALAHLAEEAAGLVAVLRRTLASLGPRAAEFRCPRSRFHPSPAGLIQGQVCSELGRQSASSRCR